jgi:hypothetical protein
MQNAFSQYDVAKMQNAFLQYDVAKMHSAILQKDVGKMQNAFWQYNVAKMQNAFWQYDVAKMQGEHTLQYQAGGYPTAAGIEVKVFTTLVVNYFLDSFELLINF